MLGFKKSWIILNECIFSVKSKHRLYIDSNGENRAPYKLKALFKNKRFMFFWNVLGIFSILLEYMLLYFQMKKHWNISPNLNLLFLKTEKLVGGGTYPFNTFSHIYPMGRVLFDKWWRWILNQLRSMSNPGYVWKKGEEQQKMFCNSFSFILWTRKSRVGKFKITNTYNTLIFSAIFPAEFPRSQEEKECKFFFLMSFSTLPLYILWSILI